MGPELIQAALTKLYEFGKAQGTRLTNVHDSVAKPDGTHLQASESWEFREDSHYVKVTSMVYSGNNGSIEQPRFYRIEKPSVDYECGSSAIQANKTVVFSNWEGELPTVVVLPTDSGAFKTGAQPQWELKTNLSPGQLVDVVLALEQKYPKKA